MSWITVSLPQLVIGSLISYAGIRAKHGSVVASGIVTALSAYLFAIIFAAGWSSDDTKRNVRRAQISVVLTIITICALCIFIVGRV